MRLIKHSPGKDPEGIRIICPYCQAEYLIENACDWDGRYSQAYDETGYHLIEVYEYESICPECNGRNWHGIDRPGFRFNNPVDMCDREDWEERFKVSRDGRKLD